MNPLPLGDMSLDRFFKEYWQKKPLLIRHAFPGCRPFIAGDELAGLACEDGVESRLIVRDESGERWDVRHGPFTDKTFLSLPDTHWTLLVQAVDHWLPEAAKFLQYFTFIPNWRIDDLMISYAGDGGGVGPHYDHYDVFLVQAGGRRRWEVGGLYDEASSHRADTPVKILTDWKPDQSWILDPGDMLYIPPRVGHNGVAVGDACMTYSVGFRAPSHKELLQEFAAFAGTQLSESMRLTDADPVPSVNPGHMTAGVLEHVHRILRQYIDDQTMVAEWFGRAMTTPKYSEEESEESAYNLDDLRAHVEAGKKMHRNEGSRWVFQEHGDETWLFVDGARYVCREEQADLARRLCAELILDPASYSLTPGNLQLLLNLLNRGSLYVED